MEFPWMEIVGNVLLFALVFGMSATVDTTSMQNQIRNRKAIGLGLFCQFVLLPLLGFLAVKILDLEPALGITLLVVVSSPGGSYSNWWCSMFNADLALSVAMTAISTILAVLFLPLNLIIYATVAYHADVTRDLDWTSVFLSLVVVISAISLGLLASARTNSVKFNGIANQIGNIAGFLLILFSATVTNLGNADSKIWSRHWTFYVACAAPCVLALLLASILASIFNLDRPERITVAVECCYQNVGIATSLALTMFQGDELHHAMGIPFFYGVCEGISVGIYCFLFWKAGWTKAPKDESLWKVLTTSYEIVSHETAQIDFTTKKEDSNNTNVGLPSIEKASEVDYVEMGNLSPLDTNNNNKKPIR